MQKKQSKKRTSRRKSISYFQDIDFSKILKECQEVKESYEEILKKANSKGKAYKVTFIDQPDLLYFTYAKTRNKARSKAVIYFRENFFPLFLDPKNDEYKKARVLRVPELDEFSDTGKVPIPKLMEHLNITFPCSACKQDDFNLSDYEKGRCFIVEGEGDLNEFTKGYILCYDCHKKYLK